MHAQGTDPMEYRSIWERESERERERERESQRERERDWFNLVNPAVNIWESPLTNTVRHSVDVSGSALD